MIIPRDLAHRILPLISAIAGACAVLLALRFGLDTQSHFRGDNSAIAPYVSAIGSLYGVLTAFTILVVWNQFNETDRALSDEARNLVDLYRYVVYLEDPSVLADFKRSISAYADAVADEEWRVMSGAEAIATANASFEALFALVRRVRLDDPRDDAAWGMIIRKLEDISDSRIHRLQLAASRRPVLLRVLLYVASVALLAGFFMLGIGNDFLAVTVTVLPTVIVVLVLNVVADIDDPIGGQ